MNNTTLNREELKKQLILKRLKDKNVSRREKRIGQSIQVADRNIPIPLSWSQQRMWFTEQLDANVAKAYIVRNEIELEGKLDFEALQLALNTVIERHEILRTCFKLVGDDPIQVISNVSKFDLKRFDLTKIHTKEIELEIQSHHADESNTVFDLENGPLIRGRLLDMSEKSQILLISMHHIISDAWSLDIFTSEVSALYEAYCNGKKNPLMELPIQYADYAVWQRDYLDGESGAIQLDYWKKELAGIPEIHSLPTDYVRPLAASYQSKTYESVLNSNITRELNRFAKSNRVTLFMLLHSIYSMLLSKFSGSDDIVVGTPIANREQEVLEPLIGFFVNTLVLRSDRTLSHNPLFQVLLVLQNTSTNDDSTIENDEQTCESESALLDPSRDEHSEAEKATLQFDLVLDISEEDGKLILNWEYSSDLFSKSTIVRMNRCFEFLIKQILTVPEDTIGNYTLLDPAAEKSIYDFSNGPRIDNSNNRLVHELFDDQVSRSPDALAVGDEYGDSEWLTYKQLDDKSNAFAHYLRSIGVTTEDRIAFSIDRRNEILVIILGILKSGAAYIPIDPTYPVQRIKHIVEDSNPKLLIVGDTFPVEEIQSSSFIFDNNQKDQTISLNIESIVTPLAKLFDELNRFPDWKPKIQNSDLNPNSTAYVIYTSGSTGRPKGVLLAHRGLTNLAQAQARLFDIKPTSRVLQFASSGFDAFTWEWVMALCNGASLQFAKRDSLLPGLPLANTLIEHGISHVTLPPTAVSALPTNIQYQDLNCLVVAGEACPPGLADEWSKGRQFVNAYGPSEATVCATVCHYDNNHLNIGYPIDNTSVFIVDDLGNPVPIGVVGEILIGGVGVAKGYLNRDELNTEKFIPDFLSDKTNNDLVSSVTTIGNLYKTGDLGSWREDGSIDFLGRNDNQVKLRGFRIELGEIEQVLNAIPEIQDAVVVIKKYEEIHQDADNTISVQVNNGNDTSSSNNRFLVAYIVPKDMSECSGSDGVDTAEVEISVEERRERLLVKIKSTLRENLAEHMVPAHFVVLKDLPLTSHGKVDRKALPQPTISEVARSVYEEPKGEIENALSKIWSDLLEVKTIGRFDNFFDLGGHSLLIMSVISRLAELSYSLDVKDAFQQKCLADWATL